MSLRAVPAETPASEDELLLELAWGVIANAGDGNWSTESAEWQDAAVRWRDRYFARLAATTELLASPDTGVAEGAGLDALPDNACGVMGLCELLKGHEGKHTTSVDRALEGVVLRATHAASPGAFNAPLDVERLARAMCETTGKRRHGGNMPNCMVKEGPWTATHRAEAQAIAAEYARFATPAPEDPE